MPTTLLGLLPDADPTQGALVHWGVPDVASAIEAAVATGAALHGPATDVGEGIVTRSVRTPNGAILGFIYNAHFKVAG